MIELAEALALVEAAAAAIGGIECRPFERIARRLNADRSVDHFVVSCRINIGTTR